MKTIANQRTGAHQARNLSGLVPGRSAKPPGFSVQASDVGPESGNLLVASVGKGGKNRKDDLFRLGKFLMESGAPAALLRALADPADLGKLVARYQKEVLRFRKPDGRIDPGGKTIGAMRALKGKETVAGWFKARKVVRKPATTPKGGAGKGPQNKVGEIPPVLSESQYFSQYNKGAPCVPLSLLKTNLNKAKTEKAYRSKGCYQTCRYMLSQAGFTPGSRADSAYLLKMNVSRENGFNKSIGGLTENFASSISELDNSLLSGVPVVVGVNNNTKNHRWTNKKPDGGVSPTDHFVVIIGKSITSDGKVAYRFFDPARYSASKGTSPSNLLIQEDGGQFTGNPYKENFYSLSEVRSTI